MNIVLMLGMGIRLCNWVDKRDTGNRSTRRVTGSIRSKVAEFEHNPQELEATPMMPNPEVQHHGGAETFETYSGTRSGASEKNARNQRAKARRRGKKKDRPRAEAIF